MRSKIVTIEDVTKIVGISNYIQALNLDQTKLVYDSYELSNNRVKVHFHYEELPITITINKEYQMLDMDCGCKPGLDYCPHIALAVMYLIEHEEEVNKMIAELNSEYDETFNQKLLGLFQKNVKNKKKITLDVNLKLIDYRNPDTYELQIRIGEDKKYVLKKYLELFLQVYHDQEGEVEFGQSFTYSYENYIFDETDQNIIDFISFYVDSQNNVYRSFYGYHMMDSKVDYIRLTGETLLQFMKLIKKHPFTVEIGYYTYHFSGIEEQFPLTMALQSLGENIRFQIHHEEIKPLISSYEYVMANNQMYHVKEANLLKLLQENKKQDIIMKSEEIKEFTKKILPKIISNTKLDTVLQEKIKMDLPTVKYYFEKKENNIIGKIMLCYQEIEKDLFTEDNTWGDIYLRRDETLEDSYQLELLKEGFQFGNNAFILTDNNAIVSFLEEGLHQLSQKYEVYVTQELKDMKVFRHVGVQSSFSLGQDNILSYQFEIEHIHEDELESFLKSLQLKKRFYRMKDGSYVDLSEDTMQEFSQMLDHLEIGQGHGILPLYKSLSLEENTFVKLDDSLQKFLDQFRTYKDIEITFDSNNESILRDYQKVGIKWMLTLSQCGFSGILADEMGLGKSLQTIEYIKQKVKEKAGIMLLVVPTSLIYNWEHELQQFGSEVKYLIINDTKQKRMNAFQKIESYDVILTTYGLLRQDITYYQSYTFDTCIIDEAQNIKNMNAETTKMIKTIKAKTRFALTGTPIENSLLELFSIFDFLMPGFLSTYANFKARYSIKTIEEHPELLEKLNTQIAPFILRRKKKDVLKELPDKIETNIYVDMSEEQKKLYLAQLEQTKKEIHDTLQKEGFAKSQILILSLLTRLRQICIDPRLYVDTDIRSGKLDALIQILEESIRNGHKILLFSQFPSALKLIQTELKENAITFYYLDGSTPSKIRMERVDAFNQDETSVFLISLKAGGTGLNLTSADIVIHLDLWWNPQVENQATDRSHRIGQKHVVEVIRLIAKGTIEEKILELQQKKRHLSDQVIEGDTRDQIILSKLTEEELLSILENKE